jgi:hypothetical protein
MGGEMNGKNFDRWACCLISMAMAGVALWGMRTNNPTITHFGEVCFAQFSGILIVLFNRELNNGNGNGNGTKPNAPKENP